jgi:hypothetical protein
MKMDNNKKKKYRYCVERRRNLFAVYDSETNSKVSDHIHYEEARDAAYRLNIEAKLITN